MKIWLDDIRQMPLGYDVWAKSSKEAIQYLKTGDVTVMSFDHDLGDEINGTGYGVARWIEIAAFNNIIHRVVWHIHSANPVGRKNIEAALINADKFWGMFEELDRIVP
jgi:uncharacterized protein YebE (UPF0316 family)